MTNNAYNDYICKHLAIKERKSKSKRQRQRERDIEKTKIKTEKDYWRSEMNVWHRYLEISDN